MPKVKNSNSDATSPTALEITQYVPRANAGRLELKVLPIDQIALDPNRPRRATAGPEHDSMVESIRVAGVITPPLVYQPDPAVRRYVLRSGERRYNACRALGLPQIPGIVARGADTIGLGLIENLQREDLSPLDEALWLAKLKAIASYTDEQLAAMVGRSRPTVSQMLGIARLPASILEEIQALSTPPCRDHLIQLGQCHDSEQQRVLLEQIKAGTTQEGLRDFRKGAPVRVPPSGDPKVTALTRVVDRLLRLEAHEDQVKAAWNPDPDMIREARRCIRLLQRLISRPQLTASAASDGASGDGPAALH